MARPEAVQFPEMPQVQGISPVGRASPDIDSAVITAVSVRKPGAVTMRGRIVFCHIRANAVTMQTQTGATINGNWRDVWP
ncbi:MAG: hypothetical protein ISQ26_04375 [Candidatus Puniceispirillum sp.]|nr:hypothetical protein [Candidatus Puniceispirillum sp.]